MKFQTKMSGQYVTNKFPNSSLYALKVKREFDFDIKNPCYKVIFWLWWTVKYFTPMFPRKLLQYKMHTKFRDSESQSILLQHLQRGRVHWKHEMVHFIINSG